MRRAFLKSLTIALALILCEPGGLAFADKSRDLDFSIPALYTLDKCVSPAELDCVESVGILTDDNQYHEATYVNMRSLPSRVDDLGNLVIQGSEIWQLTIDGVSQSLEVGPNASTPTHACCKSPDGSLKRFGSIVTDVRGVRANQRVRLVLRTSWIKPLNVPLYAARADFKQEQILGGNRWTFEGATKTSYAYENNNLGTISDKLQSNTAQADTRRDDLIFFIDHVGVTDELSPYPIHCADKGYTAEASNAFAAGQPFWDGTKLNFSIFAPHLTTDGNLDEGFFQFWAPISYMDCKWPSNSLTKSSKFSVSITDENGTQNVEASSAGITNGMFHLTASGFHYSSPTISVTPIQQTEVSSPTTAPSNEPSSGAIARPTPEYSFSCRSATKKPRLVRHKTNSKAASCPPGYKVSSKSW